MAQILQIAYRKNAGAAVFLELIEEIGGVDPGHQRALVRERPRYVRKSFVPATIPGEKEHEMPHLRFRLVEMHLVETTVGDGFRARERSGAGGRAQEREAQQCNGANQKIATHQASARSPHPYQKR